MNDGPMCEMEILVDDNSIARLSLECPDILPGEQGIYMCGNDSRVLDGQIRNFQFFSQPYH